MEIIPLTRHLGAEVRGVNLNRDLNDDLAEAIYSAFLERGVLVFPEQHLSPETHLAMGQMLGPLAPRHPLYPKVAGYEDIIIIRNDENTPPEADIWHSDLSCHANPPYASILQAIKIPPVGGDTLWCDMAAVHDALSPAMQGFLATLHAEHDLRKGFGFLQDGAQAERLNALQGENIQANQAVHPLIWHHPSSGRPVLYVNASFTTRIVDLLPAEGAQLLSYLTRLASNPSHQMRVRWQPGTVVMWDNWRTQHFATGDHYPAYREMQRVTVADDRRRQAVSRDAA